MSIGTSGVHLNLLCRFHWDCTTQMPLAKIRHLAIYICILVGSGVKNFPLVRARKLDRLSEEVAAVLVAPVPSFVPAVMRKAE